MSNVFLANLAKTEVVAKPQTPIHSNKLACSNIARHIIHVYNCLHKAFIDPNMNSSITLGQLRSITSKKHNTQEILSAKFREKKNNQIGMILKY